MKNITYFLFAFVLCFIASVCKAQHPELHVNPRWKECSFQLDPSLTQKDWHKFTNEAALVAYYRPLVDAKPMGIGRFELSILQWETKINPNTGAWNNTFVHPDSAHWLVEDGSRLAFPGLSFRMGVTRKMDIGIYWTMRPGANYGFWGAQVQYNLIDNPKTNWAASGRLSFTSLTGDNDLNLNTYGLDLLASKKIGIYSDWISISPYAGISTYLASSHEKSEVVELSNENIIGARGAIGAVTNISLATLGVEYNLASVNSFCYKIGVAYTFKGKDKG